MIFEWPVRALNCEDMLDMLRQRHFLYFYSKSFLQKFCLVYKLEMMWLGWIDFIFTLKLGDEGREKEERKDLYAFWLPLDRSILLLVVGLNFC